MRRKALGAGIALITLLLSFQFAAAQATPWPTAIAQISASSATTTTTTSTIATLEALIKVLTAELAALVQAHQSYSGVASNATPTTSTMVTTGGISGGSISRLLAPGAQGTDVSALQTFLQSKGFFSYPQVTGYFGPATAQAVSAFQAANGLEAVGSVGPKTQAILNALLSSSTANPTSSGASSALGFPSSGGGGGSSGGSGGGGSSGGSTANTTAPAPTVAPASGSSVAGGSSSSASAPAVPAQQTVSASSSSGSTNTSSSSGTTANSASNAVIIAAPVNSPVPGGSTQAQSSPPTTTFTTSASGPISMVAAGCAVPTASAHNTFYVDPVNGSASGDGSQAHPWLSLQTVLTSKVSTADYVTGYYNASGTPAHAGATTPVNAAGPVHAGDTIYLMNGNHGDISVIGVNTNFITVAAAPGQAPLLKSLIVQGASKWIFQGLKVQSLKTPATTYVSLVTISAHSWIGPVTDIIFDHNVVDSQDDISAWSQADWLANGRGGISMDGGGHPQSQCITITNNKVYNILRGVAMCEDGTLFANNTINNFGDDGLDFCGNNLVISHNTITNSNDLGDGNHEDAMQGQIGRSTGYSNILIDGNLVIRRTDPDLKFPAGLQGISAFDDDWYNVQVSNNIVVVDDFQGISFASLHGGIIVNNTLLYDGGNGATTTSWIAVSDKTHEGSSTSGTVIVRNNVSSVLSVGIPGVTVDHNIATQVNIFVAGAVHYYRIPAIYGDHNTLDLNLNAGLAKFDTTNLQYDVHLLPTSPAIAAGNPDQMPSVDIAGTPRINADLGAYAFTGAVSPSLTLSPTPTPTPTPTPAPAPSPSPAPVGSAGPVLHLTLDQSSISGTTALDTSGNNFNGTLVNAPSVVTGNIGQALSFNGINQGVDLHNLPLATLGVTGNSITISAWVQPQNLTPTTQIVFAKGATASSAANETFVIYLKKFGVRPAVDFSDGTNILQAAANSGPTLATSTWMLITATLSGQTATIYLNGVLAGTATNSSFGTLMDAGTRGVGVGYDAGATRLYMSGLVDDVRIYNRALSVSEVSQLYAGTLADAGASQVAATGAASPTLSDLEAALLQVLSELKALLGN